MISDFVNRFENDFHFEWEFFVFENGIFPKGVVFFFKM